MALVNLQTNLKSLRYGKDRVGGGSSGQPYITSSPPDSLSDLDRSGGIDFLLRGGTLMPSRTLDDVSRLTKMFADLKSPNGLLFTGKQNLLSLSSTNFEAGFNITANPTSTLGSTIGNFLRNNINFTKNNLYTPLSTIGQAAVSSLGGHLYKQGLNPLEGPTKYSEFVVDGNDKKSRLISLSKGKLTSNDTTLYSYIGGPGSVNGVGTTRIKRTEFTDYKGDQFLNYSELQSQHSFTEDKSNKIQDFRKGYNSPNYTVKNIERRVNLGNPGRRDKDISSYTKGLGTPLDKVNAFALYKSELATDSGEKNDLVTFRIGVIDNENPKLKTYIHFRAFIDSFSDNYSSQWDATKYMGRGEKMYKYSGFDRNISMGWTVAAQSKEELIPMYQKLNYLASSLTPDYSDIGYMRGNLVTLTVGGYLYEQTGIITGLNYSIPENSPWEIAINDVGEADNSVKELSHIIKVTGFNFIPIHNFVPKIQKRTGIDGDTFGNERYIALAKGTGPNSNNYQTLNPPIIPIKQFPTSLPSAPVLTNINQLNNG